MKIRHIEAFNAVMKAGSIGGGVGIEPIERATRLFPHIERLYAEITAIHEHARGARRDSAVSVGLSVVPSIAMRALPMMVRRMEQKFPNFEFTALPQRASAVLTSVAKKEVDFLRKKIVSA